MYFNSKFLRAVTASVLILCFGIFVLADTIRLKDGSVIKGKIIGFRDGQFVVAIGDGARARQMTFFADEVDSVEFDGSNAPVSTATPRIVSTPEPNRTANTNANSNVLIVGRNTANRNTNTSGDITPTYTNSNPSNSNTATPVPTVEPTVVPTATPTPVSTPKPTPIVTPTPVSTPISTPTPIPTPTPVPTPAKSKAVQLKVMVLADNTTNGWTNAGWVVKRGQKIRVNARGQVNLGNGNFAKPEGIKSLADREKLMANEATGALIAVIGDNNNDFIFIGNSREFTAQRDGMLFLGVNEGNLNDNSGAFDVTVEVEPN